MSTAAAASEETPLASAWTAEEDGPITDAHQAHQGAGNEDGVAFVDVVREGERQLNRDETTDSLPTENTPLLPISSFPDRGVSGGGSGGGANRLYGLDLFRGLIMVFESIDHSREFLSKIKVDHEEWYHMPDFYNSEKNEGMPLLSWFLRALTALCAPGFMFLMGVGIVYFTESRKKIGWSNLRIYRHFGIRAIILVFLNFFHFPFLMFMLGKLGIVLTVLYALGINIFLGSVILSAEMAMTDILTDKVLKNVFKLEQQQLVKLLGFSISCLSLVVFCFSLTFFVTEYHNALPLPKDITSYNPGDFLLLSLIPCSRCNSVVFSIYPFIPWITPVVWGLLFGRLFIFLKMSSYTKIAVNVCTGFALLFVFLGLRLGNGVGNIHNTELLHPPPLEDFINFLNLTKYPPSLSYLCWTMGINHLLLAICLAWPIPSKWNPILVFGKSALFFYVAHFYVYGIELAVVNLFSSLHLIPIENVGGRPALSFPVYCFAWLSGLLILWPSSYYYGIFKSSKGPDSIWRFF